MNRTVRRLGVLIPVAVLLALAACSGPADRPDTASSTAPDPVSPWESEGDSDPRLFTALVVQLSWGQQDEVTKQATCDMIDIIGADQFADVLREDDSTAYADTSQVDFDLAAQMIEEKCQEEGY